MAIDLRKYEMFKDLGFVGLHGGPKVITVNHWYKDRRCLGCGETFFTLVEQQGYCSDRCKWTPAPPPHLKPVHITEEKRQRLPRILVGCEYCTRASCKHINGTLVWRGKDGKDHIRDYVVQSETPYGCRVY